MKQLKGCTLQTAFWTNLDAGGKAIKEKKTMRRLSCVEKPSILKRVLLTVVLFLISLELSLVTNASDSIYRHYGNVINSGARKVYTGLVEAFEKNKLTENNTLEFLDASAENLIDGYTAFILDYPEIYWLQSFSRSFKFYNNKLYGTLMPVFYDKAVSYKNKTNKEITKINAYIATKKNTLEKVRAIHDYIIDHTTYGVGAWEGQTIISGLLTEFGNQFVCNGYAKLFQLLCINNNIPCIFVAGSDHAWNYVRLDNKKWYFVDVTFDAPIIDEKTQIKTHDHFLLSKPIDNRRVYDEYLGSTILSKLPTLASNDIRFLEDCVISSIPSQEYTGKAIKPKCDIKFTYLSSFSVDNNTSRSYEPLYAQMAYTTKKLVEGTDYTVKYSNNTNIGTAKITITGKGIYTGTITKTFSIKAPKGTSFNDTNSNGVYRVTKDGANGSAEVQFVKPIKPEAEAVIPSKIKAGGRIFLVTSIGKNAFRGSSALKSVQIGRNVSTIYTCAFYKCRKLSSVTLTAGLTTIGSGAFNGCTALTTIVIPSTVTQINRRAFYGCKNLRKIQLNTYKLSYDTIGEQVFEGIHPRTVIRVPSSLVSGYKAILLERGVKAGMKVTSK